MENKVISIGQISEPPAQPDRSVLARPEPQKRHPSPADPQDQNQFRLIIEEDQATGAFVYKTLDRTTGEVVLQFPREEVLRLREQPGYQAGAIIRTIV